LRGLIETDLASAKAESGRHLDGDLELTPDSLQRESAVS